MDVEKFITETRALRAKIIGAMQVIDRLNEQARAQTVQREEDGAENPQRDRMHGNIDACTASQPHEACGRDWVVLDVGGTHFATTRQTLAAVPSSMLAAWFSGRHAIKARPDGTVFIDRSPDPSPESLASESSVNNIPFPFHRSLTQLGNSGESETINNQTELHKPSAKGVRGCGMDEFLRGFECVELKAERWDREQYLTGSFPPKYVLYCVTDSDSKNKTTVLCNLYSRENVKTWPFSDVEHGSVNCDLSALSHEYFCIVYTHVVSLTPAIDGASLSGTMCVVVHNSNDLSTVCCFSLPYIAKRSALMGTQLIFSTLDCKTIRAYDVTSGRRLWQTDVPSESPSVIGNFKFDWNYSDEVFVVSARTCCLVYLRATGEFLYRVDCTLACEADYGYGERTVKDDYRKRRCMAVGRGLQVLKWDSARMQHLFAMFGESGERVVPDTYLSVFLGTAGYLKLWCFHGPNTLFRLTDTGFQVFRLFSPASAPGTVRCAESFSLRVPGFENDGGFHLVKGMFWSTPKKDADPNGTVLKFWLPKQPGGSRKY